MRTVERVVALLIALACVLVAPTASAAGRTIAVQIEGTDPGPVRKQILDLVPKSVSVASPQEFSDALAQAGQHGQFGNQLWAKFGRDKMFGRVRKAMEALKIDAAIIGRVRMGKGGKEVYVVWLDAGSDQPSIDEAVPLHGKDADRKAALQKTMGDPLEGIGGSAPPAAAETKKAKQPEPEAKSEPVAAPPEPPKNKDTKEEPEKPGSERKKNDFGSALFELGLDIGIGGRFFDYSDPIEGDALSSNLRPYDVFGVPMAALSAELYPLATTGVAFIKDFGITVGYARAFGLTSSTDAGEPIDTTWDRFNVGARLRWRTGEAPLPILGFNIGYGFIHFNYGDAGTLAPQVPDVSYSLLRLGLDARVPLGAFAILLGADYLAPLSAGALYDRFKNPRVGGVDLRAGVGWTATAGLEIRLQADYTRFFYAFQPEVGDSYIAGGALDHFLFLSLGVAYAY